MVVHAGIVLNDRLMSVFVGWLSISGRHASIPLRGLLTLETGIVIEQRLLRTLLLVDVRQM